jgi:gp6-like head-tail connector protein
VLVQAIRKITLPDGRKLRRGEVADLPDSLASYLLQRGLVRERVQQPALERKDARDTLDPETPFTAPVVGPVLSYQNEDNFIRNLVTIGYPGGPYTTLPVPGSPLPEPVLSDSVAGLPPVLTLDQIKTYLRVDVDYTDEDAELQLLEQAVRVATENAIRVDIDDTVGENVKAVMLLAIGRLYENREASTYDNWNMEAWLAQMLAGERDYPVY